MARLNIKDIKETIKLIDARINEIIQSDYIIIEYEKNPNIKNTELNKLKSLKKKYNLLIKRRNRAFTEGKNHPPFTNQKILGS